MNELARFPDGPPKDILIYWEPEAKRWTIWFDKTPPMYADGEYNSFREKTFPYSQVPPASEQLTSILQTSAAYNEVLTFLNGENPADLDSLRGALRQLAEFHGIPT